MVIVTDSARLSFRLMGQNDAQALWELNQDPEVMKYINGGKPDSMDDIYTQYLPRLKQFTQKEHGWGLWQVCNKESKEYLGWLLVRPMDFFTDEPKLHDIELGWRFFQKTGAKDTQLKLPSL